MTRASERWSRDVAENEKEEDVLRKEAPEGASEDTAGDGTDAQEGAATPEPGGEEPGADGEAANADGAAADNEEAGGDAKANAEEIGDAGAEPSDAGDEKKKGPFKRKEKKDKEKEKLSEQLEDLTDKLKRQMAEFDNFRKRTEREKTQMYEVGAKSVIEKILPVVDNFERGLAAVPEDGKDDAFVQGMDKVYRQLMTELENLGVVPIEAVGTEFNPDFHNAVMQVESEEYESGIVAQELQKGYMYRDSVVRHSMVAVVQ